MINVKVWCEPRMHSKTLLFENQTVQSFKYHQFQFVEIFKNRLSKFHYKLCSKSWIMMKVFEQNLKSIAELLESKSTLFGEEGERKTINAIEMTFGSTLWL